MSSASEPSSSEPSTPAPTHPPDAARTAAPESPICSAKGCKRPATWAIRWNNPKIHPPERRKTWLTCDDHRGMLTDFLNRRSFVREVEPLTDAGPDANGTGSGRSPDSKSDSAADPESDNAGNR